MQINKSEIQSSAQQEMSEVNYQSLMEMDAKHAPATQAQYKTDRFSAAESCSQSTSKKADYHEMYF